MRTSVWAVASSLVLASVPVASEAAGLGQITVFSALGQPLRAEVEVFATREEIAEMQAKLAAPDEFKRAGVDYSSTLLGISFAITKNPSGRSIIKLTSSRPINDPFVDLLLELNWPTGRLIRDYTFLLDPPEFAARAGASTGPALGARPVTPARPASEARGPETGAARAAPARPMVQARAPSPPEQPSAAGGGTRRVERGETLSKIARETRPEGVSLDQMLVGLFRANEDAFDRGNMNRLRAGKILSIPDKGSLSTISQDEARRVVIAQSSDWSSYRRKLASTAADSPAAEEEARQQASGKITTKVQDSAAPLAEPKDQLKVSKSELPGGKPVATGKRSDEDLIAKEQALKEANERLAALERNVAELQRLVELKSQSLAELEKQAAGQPAPMPPAAAIVAPAASPAAPVASAAAPAMSMDRPPAQPAESRPSEVLAQAEQKPEEPKAEVKAEEPKPVEPPKPAAAPKPKIVLPPPEEPSFLDDLLTSTSFMAAGGGILALLAAYWLARRRRQGGGEGPLDSQLSTLAPQGDNSLVANSVFRSTGGQSVDTSHSMAQTDFSQAGPGSIDTDEVDPVAEADVYMAYGRDAQAEEILLEARQKDPERHAIHLKLLEIYFSRKDIKPFDALATELFNATGGFGSDWEKAAAMGLQLDPKNALFGSAGQAEQPPAASESAAVDDGGVDPSEKTIAIERPGHDTMAVDPSYEDTLIVKHDRPAAAASEAEHEDTLVRPAEPEQAKSPVQSAGSAAPTASGASAASDLADLDFDLGAGDATPDSPVVADDDFLETTLSFPSPAPGAALDFDFATSLPRASASSESEFDDAEPDSPPIPVEEFGMPEETMLIGADARETSSQPGAGLDFEFDLGVEEPVDRTAETQEVPPLEPAEVPDNAVADADADALEFDVTLTESTVLGEGMQHPSFDMSSINLDLEDSDRDGRSGAAVPEAAESAGSAGSVFEADQEDTLVNPDFSTTQADSTADFAFSSDMDLASDADISSSEEVATKIDLAKAYQEMGDLEGARELLQEVIKDGDAAQREAALAILGELRE
ncbi:FimV/HubP family polar landmark protein [Accumulibacter sp.]|uniref:FimV/HubP family polar landmark protein n=1 Tax=Accumulibacter sp. TaxID=2053492 RepID=UPI001ACF59D8|nr:FimV/HubP family polar landmark protein [Accumulibacter sp.]MBN8513039.1 pilus assembly protein [Accumulibacter sp.]MBO3700943.1 pilus assembly protein [Accumulibacter sp.]